MPRKRKQPHFKRQPMIRRLRRYSNEKIREVALDLHKQQIFCGSFIKPPELITQVFMPIALGGLDNYSRKARRHIGQIWEYYGEHRTSMMAINGYPIFYSMNITHQEDWNKIVQHFDRLNKVTEELPMP